MTKTEKAQAARAVAMEAEIAAMLNGAARPQSPSPRDFTNAAAAKEAARAKNKRADKKS